ncbi:MAG: acyl carrier protein [Mycoplasmoidaceae bacterium]|nr:acyl carrier protein [Mycoplasmoidaceae bacterium]
MIDKNNILQRLKKILKDALPKQVNLSKVELTDRLVEDLGFNSVAMVYMAFAIEKEFSVDISDLSFASFKTINDVINYIVKHTK